VYLDAADLQRRLSEEALAQLTDDLETGEPDPQRLAEAIADAEAEVNAYLQERYSLPLATVPPLVVRIVADLAVWQLYGRRQLTDEAVEARYKAAVKLCEQLAAGKVSLGVAAPPAEVAGGAQVVEPGTGRVFTRGTLKGF